MTDTLMYFKKLEAAGFSRKQAEAQVEMMRDLTEKNFANKEDVKDLRQETKDLGGALRQEMSELRTELRNEMSELRGEVKDLRVEFRSEIRRLETELSRMGDRLTIRLGGMMILGFGALAALIKLG